MSLSLTHSPAYRSFVGNPVRFTFQSDNEKPLICTLVVAGNEIYSFSHIPFQGTCRFDIADILSAYITTPVLESSLTETVIHIKQGYTINYNLVVTTGIDGESVSFDGVAFWGGISKKLFRELQGMGLDMFSYRLANPQRQFFFTTRTNGRNIRIRENEIAPLLFLAPAEHITIVTENGRVIIITALVRQDLYALNIPAMRKLIYDTYGELPAYFSLLINDHHICDITLLPATAAVEYNVLRFRNSLGVYECIALAGKTTRSFESEDESSYSLYDQETSGYITGYYRLPVTEIRSTQTGSKPPSELIYLNDLLSSDDVCLLTPGAEAIPVHVTAEKFQVPVTSLEPISVPIKIHAIEQDAYYSPPIDMNLPAYNYGEWIFENGSLNSWGIIYNDRRLIETK